MLCVCISPLVPLQVLLSLNKQGFLPAQVRPLRRQLKGLKAWITGQRKDQSPGTRADIPLVQVDPAFEGVTGGTGSLIKFNPLADMSSAEVWNFLRVMVRPDERVRSLVQDQCLCGRHSAAQAAFNNVRSCSRLP